MPSKQAEDKQKLDIRQTHKRDDHGQQAEDKQNVIRALRIIKDCPGTSLRLLASRYIHVTSLTCRYSMTSH